MRKLPRALLEALVACLGQTGEDILGVDPLGVPVEEPGVPDPLSGAPGGVKRKAAESLFTSPAKKPTGLHLGTAVLTAAQQVRFLANLQSTESETARANLSQRLAVLTHK